MTRAQAAAVRLRAGVEIVYRHRSHALAAWVARGRRHDLTGWQAAIGSWVRLAVLAAAAYGGWCLVQRWPALMWAAALAAVAAWRAGSPREQKGPPPAAEAPTPADPDPADGPLLAAAVRALAGDGAGAHLAGLADRLTETTGRPWTTASVRAACAAASIPVTPSVRQPGRGVSTGVRVSDLPQPLPDPPPGPAVAVVVAGHTAPTGVATPTATPGQLQPAVREEGALTIIRDPSETRAYTV